MAPFLLREPDRSPSSVIFAVVFPPTLFAPRLMATARPMKLANRFVLGTTAASFHRPQDSCRVGQHIHYRHVLGVRAGSLARRGRACDPARGRGSGWEE